MYIYVILMKMDFCPLFWISYVDDHITANGKLITNWYHKTMASNRILNFYSSHPSHMKENTAKNFIRKVFGLSHKVFWTQNLERIKTILDKNNFPKEVIERLINSVRQQSINQANGTQNTQPSYRSLCRI